MGTNITGIGNANAIGFKSRVTGGMYFPPELKDALVGVWSAYGKSNDSTDRNIIKNKIKDRGGDFELINFNYEGTSGYNGYPVIFGEDKTYQYINHSSNYNQTTINVTHFNTRQALLYSYVQQNGELTSYNRDYPSYKIKVSGLEEGFGLIYQYNNKADATSVSALRIETDGIYTIPKSFTSNGSLTNASVWVGFMFTGTEQEQCNVTIEVLPEYKGAVVTDGVDDMVVSTKTMSEILEGSNEVTVISMMANLEETGSLVVNVGGKNYLRNIIASATTNKCGIFGYSSTNINTIGNISVINNILGDKNDYTANYPSSSGVKDVFSVSGFEDTNDNTIKLVRKIVWYWTFIAKRVLTEDEINLVIEKYNLDRPGEIVKPQVYYNIKKQKISNDNHSAFDDKLIDYSGNGYDAKLYNFGWKEDSGIGKYETDFTDWKRSFKVTSFDSESIKFTSDVSWVLLYHPSSIGEDIPSFKVRIKLYGKGTLYYNYITQEGKYTNVAVKSEIFETPICYNTKYTGEKGVNVGFTLGVISGECSGTITQIPEYENALVLDGVDDYGKVTGLPILKDYTVAADYIRTFAKENAQDSPILSKSKVAGSGAFLFNYLNADSITSSYSFGTNNILKEINDSERKIYYLSKYASDGHNVNAGSAVDYDTMWLGTYGDNISNFFTGALYFAMLFPYSLSEFLLERQIKKARAGTLYPNQVEFRPIIPEDENITKIDYFVVNSGVWTVIKPGDYVDVGARIVLNVYTKLPYKIEKVSSLAFTGMSVEPSTELNIFDVEGYIKDKTPQKIKLTLAINEDIVQWNPAITSNLLDSFTVSSWYLNGWDNTLTVGTWIKKTDRVFFKATFKTELYGLETATFGGTECVVSKANNWSDSKNIWDIRMLGTVGDLSQVFNLDVYELIRFEDIVQPFPTIFELKNIDTNVTYTYGSKLKIGSEFLFDKWTNLLPELYRPTGSGRYNGNEFKTGNTYIVERTMTFSWSSPMEYLLDSEPKCIFSPSKLRMPNESYRYLGYIPDISGNGNNGVFNNFAFSKMSGANGYLEDFTIMKDYGTSGIVRTESKIYLNKSFNYKEGFWLGYTNNPSPAYKVRVSGIPETGMLTYTGGIWLNLVNGINELPARTNTAENHGFVVQSPGLDWSKLVIEQIGNYEGSICFDGVDDYMDIPSLSIGGKQVLMKTNWLKSPTLLYDQRASGSFAILTTKEDDATNPRIAYQARNQDGKTYIDGIENNYIETYSLKGITHNITVTNPSAGSGVVPVIGANTGKSSGFAKMALYDFMLFDEVSTNEEIKQLNDIVGIEGGYVQKPPYYWDAYGKTNLDADKATIQQRGVAVGDYDLTNTNFAYDKMSGFGGYTLSKFTNSWSLSNNSNSISIVARNPYDITLKKLGGNSDWEFNTTELKLTSNPVSVKFKSDKNIRFTCDYHYYTVGGNGEGAPLGITSKDLIANEDTIITISPISQENIDKYNIDINRGYYLIYFQLSPTLAVNEEVTIEMLPLYPNGLVYDGVDDYSENTSIPAFTDYTYIFKRTILNIPSSGVTLLKGSHKTNGGAFIADYSNKWQFNFGQYNTIQSIPDGINWQTSSSFNGISINRGTNTDDEGITVSRFSNRYTQMVFYKLMLYPRTTDMLTINMIKNMMAEDGIIDIQGKLFTDKFTGDFNLDFNNDFLIGN